MSHFLMEQNVCHQALGIKGGHPIIVMTTMAESFPFDCTKASLGSLDRA